MRTLTKIALAGSVTLVAGLLIRRLLSQTGDEGAQAADPAAELRSSAVTHEQLYREAVGLGIRGRSKMNKRQLQQAVEAAKTGGGS
jgi:hypothetical protein